MEVAATIAVLPFENPSGDPEQEYFARGFVEDVVTELSRFPTLEVIHPRTSFTLGGGHPADRTPDGLRIGYRSATSSRSVTSPPASAGAMRSGMR